MDSNTKRVRSRCSPVIPPHAELPMTHEDYPEARVSPALDSVSCSASELAKARLAKWLRAEDRLHCSLARGLMHDVHGLATFSLQLTYPRSIKEQQCIDWASRVEERKREDRNRIIEFQSISYGRWINSLPDSSFEESDPYDIREMFRTLLYNWDTHEATNVKRDLKEAEIRLGVDSIIALAFEFRFGGKHRHRADIDLSLPAPPWVATAGSVCMIDLPADWMNFLILLPNNYIFSAGTGSLAVTTFVFEAKIMDEKVAERRLTFDLCSCQHQRRALGFDDSDIYGATLVDRTFRFYVSKWMGDTVVVIPANRGFDLSHLNQFISCYITLCKLADLEASNVRAVFDKWDSEEGKQIIKARNVAESRKRPWRKI